MWEWMKDNVTTLQVLVSLLSTGVWIAYLHVFVASFKRQTRSSLLITRVGGRDLNGRCIVSNMGSEPAYLLDVLAEFQADQEVMTVSIVDRLELWDTSSDVSSGVSAVGPITSGSYVDIGRFEDFFNRARKKMGKPNVTEETQCLKLIAIAATSQARDLIAAYRNFEFKTVDKNGTVHVMPVEVEARQVKSRRKRKQLTALLQDLQNNETLSRDVIPEVGERSGWREGLRAAWHGVRGRDR
ncbi:hypothetical protein DU478_18860 [Thalassococcus profundi]|uniref:Uncharacterized protein n=2 Tax=Thalassococcus profundi TaxID=2282382 RepID=A0A369THB7_9RHOB|nr:hypothetical protein DU478_18860 [Thalassococcus profundi]